MGARKYREVGLHMGGLNGKGQQPKQIFNSKSQNKNIDYWSDFLIVLKSGGKHSKPMNEL